MAWVEGELERSFVVEAPHEDVVEFFCEPAQFKDAFSQMETAEEVEPGTWSWTLREKSEKGITFQGKYTVKYERDGDTVAWETLEGNTNSKGTTSFTDLGRGQTEVHYAEVLRVDLPIPKLMAKVFKPIVSREVSGGIGEFLDRAKEILEERA